MLAGGVWHVCVFGRKTVNAGRMESRPKYRVLGGQVQERVPGSLAPLEKRQLESTRCRTRLGQGRRWGTLGTRRRAEEGKDWPCSGGGLRRQGGTRRDTSGTSQSGGRSSRGTSRGCTGADGNKRRSRSSDTRHLRRHTRDRVSTYCVRRSLHRSCFTQIPPLTHVFVLLLRVVAERDT